MKFFWRAKKQEASESVPQATAADDTAAAGPANDTEPAAAVSDADTQSVEPAEARSPAAADGLTASNVVTLPPSRLTERIAAAAMKTVNALAPAESVALSAETLKPRSPGALPGQEAAYEHLARALASTTAQAHILVAGTPGSGRRTAVVHEIERLRMRLPRPCDWLYVANGDGRKLEAFSLPHGQGGLLAREVKAAIARARANHIRLLGSDDYRLGLELIEEEFRQRAGKTLDVLKRRAEEQNIALVKTPEGFVLAPMHEGKVVRNDVFRALPESLQRDVEAKIAELEGELKAFIEALPAEDSDQAERIQAFKREAALRAVKPQMQSVRAAFGDCSEILDAVQASLVVSIASEPLHGEGPRAGAVPPMQVLAAQTAADFAEKAPVVLVHDASAAALCGEIGRDGAGQISLSPGALMKANGGFLIIEAWRLAADPRGWAALSAALETGQVRPISTGGLVAEVDPLPFTARAVLIADEASLRSLHAIDPGLRRFFPHVIRLPATLARASMGVAEYASFAAALAAASGLPPIAATASDALYRAALARDGSASTLVLDAHALRALLQDASLEAEAAGSPHIRSTDVEAAARRAGEAPAS